MHPRSKQRHSIDLAICLRGDIRDLEVTKVMREAECWTDHHLVNSVLTMHTIPTHHKKKIIRPPFNVSKLTNISREMQFAQDLGDRLTSHGHMTGKWKPVQNPCEGVREVHCWTETEGPKENHFGDSEDDAVDEVAHEKLLNSLFAMDGKTRNKNNVRGVSAQSVNLDLVVHAKRDQGKIKPQDLKLKARDMTDSLKKPMSSMETEQIKRHIARETIKTEMTTWEPVVQEIRSAPQMIFSNRPHGVEMRDAMKPKGFKPRTPLEKELFAALGQSEEVLNPNQELTKAEERALKAMSVKEAMARRAELMKHHELLSRAQIRAKRVKKIKSKRYRKILRKEKEGAERKELEKLQQTDQEAFVERLEQLEKDRMEERLTLKHRGGGKFARLHKVYSKFDDKTREAMQDMLQKSRELTKKTENVSSSDEEDEQADVEMVQQNAAQDVADSEEDESRPSSTSIKPSQLEILKAINKKAGGWLDGPKSTFVYTDERPANASQPDESSDVHERLSGDSQSVVPQGEEKKPASMVNNHELESENEESSGAKLSGKKRTLDEVDPEVESNETAAPEPKKKKRKRNKKKDIDVDGNDEASGAKAPAKPKEKAVTEVTLETVDEREAAEDEEAEVDEDDSLKVTMEELFQDEDVVEQFAKEKAAAEAKARPKFEDTRLPGWGSWAGPDYKGEKPLTKKQKRAEARAKQLEKQQQKIKQPHVWLNPSRDDAVRKLQPKAVPFPYSSVQQYEASLRQPVSRGFVRETAFKLLNKPEVVTKLGHIIKPLDKEDIFKKKASSDDVNVEAGTLASGKGDNPKDRRTGSDNSRRKGAGDKRQNSKASSAQTKQKRKSIS
ncbi:U3 small nucleolar RNA-associated protein 14 like protein A [Elysia marginata]|uniref:U3 small nucleolar RNA-associated protein 14 like protein A n=1 Tax=Elysia marginata TaxID=1093978 RepID=A0AAV4ITJ9_9GAST|nr:U3 small nucleolar RNA-associated protein 14 like protein A [Elysia marginata]